MPYLWPLNRRRFFLSPRESRAAKLQWPNLNIGGRAWSALANFKKGWIKRILQWKMHTPSIPGPKLACSSYPNLVVDYSGWTLLPTCDLCWWSGLVHHQTTWKSRGFTSDGWWYIFFCGDLEAHPWSSGCLVCWFAGWWVGFGLVGCLWALSVFCWYQVIWVIAASRMLYIGVICCP